MNILLRSEKTFDREIVNCVRKNENLQYSQQKKLKYELRYDKYVKNLG